MLKEPPWDGKNYQESHKSQDNSGVPRASIFFLKKIFHLTFNQSFTEENGLSRHLVYYSPCWKHLNQSFALEVAKFFYKEPESKYFSISGHIVAATTIQLCGGKAAIDINE